MIEIKGKYNSAKVLVNDYSKLEEACYKQILNLLNQKFSEGSNIAIMPDTHAGAGCVIGFTQTISDKIVPNLVGVDIGCYDKETEYLTPSGWKSFSEYNGTDFVLQYNKDTGKANFEKPIAYISKPCNKWFYFKNNKGLNLKVSEEHKLLIFRGYKSRGYITEDVTPTYFLEKSLDKGYYNFKSAFMINNQGIEFSDDEIRLLIAISTDGTIRKSKETEKRVEFHLKKERKITRLITLLNNLDIKFHFYDGVNDTIYIDFYCSSKFSKDLSVLYMANEKQLKIVTEECLLWDGHSGYRSFYSSTNKNNIDVIQFAFSATERRTGIYEVPVKNKNWNKQYSCIPTKNNFVGVTSIQEEVADNEYKYCFTMPSGYLVVRRGGVITISGNCGMLILKIKKEAGEKLFNNEGLSRLDNVIRESIPVGMKHRNTKHTFCSKVRINEIKAPIKAEELLFSIGSLGGGNHFIEVDRDTNGDFYIVIHSGSRHLGIEVCKYYQNKAINFHKNNFEEQNKLIAKLKAEGREKDIQAELSKTKKESIPNELAYLIGDDLENYLHDMELAQEYAVWNREAMLDEIIRGMGITKGMIVDKFCTIHNYVDVKNRILRKGAISLQKDEVAIIPINMSYGSLIVKGKGNAEYNYSGPHGAGRLMSRSAAKESLNMEDFKDSMKDVFTTSVCRETIDEAPMAYKPADEILANIKDLCDVINIIKPIYNLKAAE